MWADMISRWAGVTPTTCHVKRATTRSARQGATPKRDVRPLDQDNLVWPTLKGIQRVQQEYKRQLSADAHLDDDGVWRVGSLIRISTNATDLIKRLMIVAHCGPQGHRGRDSMLLTIQRVFSIANLRKHVDTSLRRCLLCLQVKGGKVAPRPWAETMHCFIRNLVLHWDFLQCSRNYTGTASNTSTCISNYIPR